MRDVDPHPFRTRPYLRSKVWGGRKLPEEFGKSTDSDDPIGEAWEASDRPEGQSHVDSGPLEGTSLGELVDHWGADLVGTASDADEFPLLVKILDAADDLSVQVHPSEEDVRETFPEAESKDECWVILGVDEGGSILHGVRDGTTAEDLRRGVEEGHAAELLRRVHVEPGQVVRVVPGTIHAICEGVVLLEIQHPSDTTYRVYDYDRPGLDGEPRELHLEEALEVANFGEQPPTSIEGKSLTLEGAGELDLLVDVPDYRVERLRTEREPVAWSVDPASVQVVHVLEGDVAIRSSSPPVELTVGQTAILPASTGDVELHPLGGTADVVVSGVGGVPLVRSS